MPQTGFIGFDSLKNLSKLLVKHKPAKIFLVSGKSSYEKSGAEKKINGILDGFRFIRFNGFEENPKLPDITRGIKAFKGNDCDFVIAVGGGSVIDVAKSINLLSANDGKAEDYIKNKKKIKNKGKTLIAIPTTAGTGSEATKFAVVYIGKTKYSLEHEFCIPDYSIVDPNLTLSLPKTVTACSGMDALCQGIESYWSVNSTKESREYAKEAIKLVVNNLVGAVNKPSRKTRESMAIAANLAGKAINISKTTACHSVSYPITSYFDVPHGHAVALTLAPMLVYNSNVTSKDVLDKRGFQYVKKTIKSVSRLTGAGSVKDAALKIKSLMKKIGLSTSLSGLGIKTKKDISIIIKNGFNPSRIKNNPRILTENALRKILEEIR